MHMSRDNYARKIKVLLIDAVAGKYVFSGVSTEHVTFNGILFVSCLVIDQDKVEKQA